jgi:hypothetical protein
MEIIVQKGFPKDPLSLKQGDVFFVAADQSRPYLVIESSRIVNILTGHLFFVGDFRGSELTVARKTTVTIEV